MDDLCYRTGSPERTREHLRRKIFTESPMPRVVIVVMSDVPVDIGPWEDVPIPRVPMIGEHIQLVDDGQWMRVISVDYRYVEGFAYEPDTIVTVAPSR